MHCGCTSRKFSRCSVCLLIFGAAAIILGIVTLITKYPQKLVDNEFKKHIIIDMDSPTFSDWINPPPPIYMQYYLFNVTNKDDVVKGKKATVKEIGPYTYRMYVPRTQVEIYTNSTASYVFNHTLIFQPEMSPGLNENDLLYHVNMPLVTVAGMIENMDMSTISSKIFALLLKLIGEKNLVEKHSVREILFGYVDPFFSALNDILELIGLHYDPVFAPFHTFNNTGDGVYLVHTGKSEYLMANEIVKWNGNKLLSYWNTEYANMINGTDGSVFQPKLKKTEERYVYFSDMCRSLKVTYEKETTVKGVNTYRFHYADDIFTNATIKPENAAFCVPTGHCYDSGVYNVAPCHNGAPVLLSNPHFYNGAAQYQNGVNGLNPSKEKHDSRFDVEPTSGIVFKSVRNVQVNLEMKKSRFINELKNIQHTVFPSVWLSGIAEMDDSTANEFRGIAILTSFMNVVGYVMIAAGVLLIFFGFCQTWYVNHKADKDLLLDDDQTHDQSLKNDRTT